VKAAADIDAAQATLEERLGALETSQEDLLATNKFQELAKQQLEEDLDDIVSEKSSFDNDAFRASQPDVEAGDVNEVKLLDQMVAEDAPEFEKEMLRQARASFGENFPTNLENNFANIISKGSNQAYDAFAEATCSGLRLPKGAKARGGKRKGAFAGAICTDIEGIDPIVDVYAEEFTIERNMIFKGSHVFDELRSNLADIGYEAEVGELTEFVSGPEFAGEAGELISAVTEGALAAEDAVGALDIASIGLGGEAFVDGLALEVGGDALLGEIALDILEIAIFL
jgi:hypothetical protein